MGRLSLDKLEDLHSQWLEETCTCESIKYCICMDLNEWYDNELASNIQDNEEIA